MAYNSSTGVCFEAIKDIKAGEELMALFDSLKGTVVVKSYWAKHLTLTIFHLLLFLCTYT